MGAGNRNAVPGVAAVHLSRIIWQLALRKSHNHTEGLILAEHDRIRPVRLRPELLGFKKGVRPLQVMGLERHGIKALAITFHLAALWTRLRERLREFDHGIFTDRNKGAALAARGFFFMNQFAAEDIAVEAFRARQVTDNGRDMRGPLDSERMLLAPEVVGPGRLQTRVDSVFANSCEFELAVSVFGMGPDGKTFLAGLHLLAHDVKQAKAVAVELSGDFLNIVDVPGD